MSKEPIKVTVVYDNRSLQQDLTPDWGFACVVDAAGHRLLFDTGAKGDRLLANVRKLGIDPATFESLVISHNHRDHTGGLESVLPFCWPRRPLSDSATRCYVPASAGTELGARVEKAGGTSIPVTGRASIWPGVWLTGELGDAIKEQSLVLETDSGLILITGCAHPGVVNIARRVKEDFGRPPRLVLGGFHLGDASAEEVSRIISALKALGVTRAGPGHCTGEQAIAQFRQSWPDGYERIGCGWVLKLEVK